MPRFYCFNCNQHINADESLAGSMATCPSCQIKLYVPGDVVATTITAGTENRKSIASRLIELESRQPGLVRIRINPGIVPHMAKMLKEMGFKKPFMQSPQQFIVDCALSYHTALTTLLELTLFSGPNSGNAEFDCWYGDGEYAGWQGHFQLQNYQALSENKIFIVINISTFFPQISDLLCPIHRR